MNPRPRAAMRGWLAAILTALLVTSGLSIGALPASAVPGPAVAVTAAPAAGGEVTVTGSGFDTASVGVYVGLAPAGGTGFYAVSAAVVDLVWVDLSNEDGASEMGRTGKLNADGSFSVTLTVPAATEETPEYAVYTSKAHGKGVMDPSQNTITVVGYAAAPEPEPAAPALTVSTTDGLNPDADKITVTGSNIKTGFPNRHGIGEAGVYAQIGYLDDLWRPSQGAPSSARSNGYSVWVKESAPDSSYLAWTDNGDGTADFSWDLDIDYDTLVAKQRAGATLAVFTLGGGGVVQAVNELVVPISFDLPTVSVSKTAGLDSAGETVTVTGSGFLPHPPQTSGTRRPLEGKFGGTYIAFGKFAEVWQPSTGATGSTRASGDTRWAVLEDDLPALGNTPGGVVLNEDGTFEVTLTVKKGFSGEPATGNYGIYTYSGGGAVYERFETVTPISFTPRATDLTFTTSPARQVTEGGNITLRAQLGTPTPGAIAFTGGSKALGTVTPTADGTATLVVPSLPIGSHTLTAAFTPTDPGSFAPSTASLSFAVVAKPAVAAGSLIWGFKQSFRDYITGSIAQGSISTSGVGSTGSAFVFGQGSGGTFNGSTGTSNYTGSVRFLGHLGELDLRLGNPIVRVDSAGSGILFMTVNGTRVPFASLALASGSRAAGGGTVGYTGVPATLTSQGAAAFVNDGSQFYPAGTALDPVSFVIGSPSTPATGAQTVAAFAAPGGAIPPTPPATTGITLDGASAGSLAEGDQVTITANGFEPDEQGIKVVIYSEPVVLATDVTADAGGTVTWTGLLPAGLTGQHTLTLQGSVDRGVELNIAERAVTMATGCVVDDASLSWGFKEAFRSYISGSIANGEWTVAGGASYETPSFGWSNGEGTYDADSADGLISLRGSVQFTGHGGALDTTIANPQLRFDGEGKATLLLDVTGTTQGGDVVNQPGVEFATIDLAAAEQTAHEGRYSYAGAPAVLAAAGAAAFGTYDVGEELDPVTVAFSIPGDCAAPAATGTDDGAAEAVTTDPDTGWVIWLIVGLLAIAAAVATGIVIVRRRGNA